MRTPKSPSASILVMGVSGSGKSTLGAGLAARLQMRFVEGDDLHPRANRDKLAAGLPLDDADRAPWLAAIARLLRIGPAVVACSALRRRYRDELRAADPRLQLIYLRGERATLLDRLIRRKHHFMPATLLDSQLATLEPPAEDEHALVLNIECPVAELVAIAASVHVRAGRRAPQ